MVEEDKMDSFDQELEKGNMIGHFLGIGDISAKEISFTSNSDNVFEKMSADTSTIHGLSDDMRGVSDNNILEQKEMNDILVDTRVISDTAEVIVQVVMSGVMETINVVENTSLPSKNESCLLESHL